MSSSSSSQSGSAVRFGDFPFEAHVDWAKQRTEVEHFENILGSQVSSPSAYVIPPSTSMEVTHPTNIPLLELVLGINIRKEQVVVDEPAQFSTRLLGTASDPWESLFGSSAYLKQQGETVKKYAENQEQGDIEHQGDMPQQKIIEERGERGKQGEQQDDQGEREAVPFQQIAPGQGVEEVTGPQEIGKFKEFATQQGGGLQQRFGVQRDIESQGDLQPQGVRRSRFVEQSIAQQAQAISNLLPLVQTRKSEVEFVKSKIGQLRQA